MLGCAPRTVLLPEAAFVSKSNRIYRHRLLLRLHSVFVWMLLLQTLLSIIAPKNVSAFSLFRLRNPNTSSTRSITTSLSTFFSQERNIHSSLRPRIISAVRMKEATTLSSSNAGATTTPPTPQLPSRINETLDPCVVLMKSIISKHRHLWNNDDTGGIVSLAQGVVYWTPPATCTSAMRRALSASSKSNLLHTYAPEAGLPALVSALTDKLTVENDLSDVHVMVTAGANQAYTNCVLTLLGDGHDNYERGVVFCPYYFNHVMAMQMCRGRESVLIGPTTTTGIPDTAWLRNALEEKHHGIKMVTVVNPGNPTGVSMSRAKLVEISDLCAQHGVWLVVDCTYEHFDHVGANSDSDAPPLPTEADAASGGSINSSTTTNTAIPFPCVNAPHVIHIFSFSKGYAMAGFRVGYLTVSKRGIGNECYQQMVKVQDTIPICVSRISQTAALGALEAGRDWVTEKVATLSTGRDAILAALSPLETIMGGSGAMYVMGKLPEGIDDEKVSEFLVEKFGVAIIPGSFCGFPGWIRVCYSNLPPAECERAAKRLGDGIESIVNDSTVFERLLKR